jgi:hypothetical protein
MNITNLWFGIYTKSTGGLAWFGKAGIAYPVLYGEVEKSLIMFESACDKNVQLFNIELIVTYWLYVIFITTL